MPHQEAAVSWMRSVEEECVVSVGRRISLPCTGWGVDLTDSSLVQDSRRDEKLFSFRTKGGILADGAGMGKTATALRLVSETRGRPTLAVVPLNLPSQWIGEVEKFAPFLKVTRLLTGKDARSTTLSCLESSDLVITTPSFFKNGAYSDLVEGLLAAEQQQHPVGGKISMEKLRGLRSAILSAWERRTRERGGEGEAPPLLEAVRWGRLLVDEIHEMGKEGKKWKGEREGGWSLPSFLRGLRFEKVWGLSATPGLDEGGKHSLLSLFADLPPFSVSLLPSPQLVSSLTRSCVRGSPSPRLPRSSLRLIDVGGKEGDDLRAETRERPLEEAIRRVCAFADVEGEGCSLLTSSSSFPSFASSSIRRLAAREDVCTLCEDRSCDAATSCGHVYCSSCLLRCIGISSSCPACRAALTTQDVHLVLSPPANAKLTVIRDLVLSNAPSIVFAQWKDTLRSIRSLLRSSERGGGEEGGAIGLLLEGNAVQRASILSEFERKGGVLLICLSDSFAGLHLPFVETVLFAHALVGDKKSVSDVETQAIARAIRKGRRGTVRVFHVVLSDCAEEELWRSTH